MSTDGDLDGALERVLDCARAHLSAVRAAAGDAEDDALWAAYVALNNATLAYDRLLEQTYGEVTPWEVVDELTEDGAEEPDEPAPAGSEAGPDNLRISVRQRRDYLVPEIES